MTRIRTNLSIHMMLIGLVLAIGALALSGIVATTSAQATTIEVTTTDDELNDDGDCSLREAVQAANTNAAVDTCPAGGAGSDTINLPAGTYTLALPGISEDANATGDLDLIDNLVIVGQGADQTIVDGGGIDRVLHIASGITADIAGVTIQHGHILTDGDQRGAGGGIHNQGHLALSDSVVRENNAEVSGGGIDSANNVGANPLLQPGDAILTLQNTRVLSNTADGGGGIFAAGTVTLRDSGVNGNRASTAFGGISIVGSAIIASSTINENESTDQIGGLSVFGSLTMAESEVSHNSAPQIAGLSASNEIIGVSLPGEITLTGNTISHNQARAGVGGLVVQGNVTMDGCTISHNSVSGDAAANPGNPVQQPVAGGMMAGGDSVTLRNSTIFSNTAITYGGGLVLSVDTVATLSGMTIRENVASQGFGGGIANFGNATIENSTITMNAAPIRGGGGIANLGQMEVHDTTISANTSTQWAGGGIANGDNTLLDEKLPDGFPPTDIAPTFLQIIDSTIEANRADLGGGGIFNEEGASIAIIDSTLHDNRAERADSAVGGALTNVGTLEISGSRVEGNESASSTGGIFNAPQGVVIIHDSEIIRNSAQQEGGGVENTGTMTLIDTTISANSSTGGSGIFNGSLCEEEDPCALPQVRATLEMQNTTVSDNTAASICGGIFNYGDLVMSNGSQVTGNQVQGDINTDFGGGGICNLSTENIRLPDRKDNFAFNEIMTGTMSISDSTINGNHSDHRAGGIINEGYLDLSRSTVANNQATSNGGGIVNTHLLTITDTTIRGNTALNDSGGGIDNLFVLRATRTTIAENSASNGAGVSVSGGRSGAILTNVTISDNTANISGGGIVVDASAYLGLINATISHNRVTDAERAGAGLLVRGEVDVWNSIVAHNSGAGDCAPRSQGTIISFGSNLASDNTCPFTTTTDLLTTDPLLGDLQDNGGPTLTRALQQDSPAIDAGTNANCSLHDQRGFARAIDGDGDEEIHCDIGAFEYGSNETLEIVSLPLEAENEEGSESGENGQDSETHVITGTITPQGGSIAITNGTVTFPPGAVTSTIIISYTDLPTDTISPITDTHHVFRAFRLEAITSEGQPVQQFDDPLTMTLTYDADNLAAQKINAEQLTLFFWDDSVWRTVEPSEQCLQCGTLVNTDRHEVIMRLDHLTDFALTGIPEQSVPTSPVSYPVYLPVMGGHLTKTLKL